MRRLLRKTARHRRERAPGTGPMLVPSLRRYQACPLSKPGIDLCTQPFALSTALVRNVNRRGRRDHGVRTKEMLKLAQISVRSALCVLRVLCGDKSVDQKRAGFASVTRLHSSDRNLYSFSGSDLSIAPLRNLVVLVLNRILNVVRLILVKSC